jgi:hypothetical protein
MLGERVIETTASFQIYFGAQLDPGELERFCSSQAHLDLLERDNLSIVTSKDGYRQRIPYDPAIHRETIGRERDEMTGQVKAGLGRRESWTILQTSTMLPTCTWAAMECESRKGIAKLPTVEVRNATWQIVQARGLCNRLPTQREREVLHRWGSVAGVSIASYV